MTAPQDQIIRKTVSLPERLWKQLGDHRFYRRFPTETAAVVDVVSRGLTAGAVLGAIADIATGRRNGSGEFSSAAARTFGNGPLVLDLVESEIRRWSVARGMTLTETQIADKAKQVCDAAEGMAGGRAAHGQAAILDIAVESLIEWAFSRA